jgi:hypothetical protein
MSVAAVILLAAMAIFVIRIVNGRKAPRKEENPSEEKSEDESSDGGTEE